MNEVGMVDVLENIQKQRLAMFGLVEMLEHSKDLEKAALARLIAEAMEVNEQMVKYLLEAA